MNLRWLDKWTARRDPVGEGRMLVREVNIFMYFCF